jgi:hypothetical protein
MSIEIQAMALADLPFDLGTSKADNSIIIQSEPDEDAVADGETEPFDWMDLRNVRENFSRLIDAGKVAVEAVEATLILSYPLTIIATRLIRPVDGKSFTRGELVTLIDETYREVYRLEANSQSLPTPPVQERGHLLNRPKSDGMFGIWGHDLDDLGIEKIGVYRIDGRIWLHPEMVS